MYIKIHPSPASEARARFPENNTYSLQTARTTTTQPPTIYVNSTLHVPYANNKSKPRRVWQWAPIDTHTHTYHATAV